MNRAPQRIETARLILRRPMPADAQAIFDSYASDPEVTRFMAWTTHRSLADTLEFLQLSDAQWAAWKVGAYLVELRERPGVIGSSGLAFPGPIERAETGYIFAKPFWGRGFATESLLAMVELARALGVQEIAAFCHTKNTASQRVLVKGGLATDRSPHTSCRFPNLQPGDDGISWRYRRSLLAK